MKFTKSERDMITEAYYTMGSNRMTWSEYMSLIETAPKMLAMLQSLVSGKETISRGEINAVITSATGK